MGRKLTIPYYRPTFVQKELSEVGDGTAYPIQVTTDQLAEIFYRVKDAWFTSGKMAGFGAGTIQFTGTAPPDEFLFIEGTGFPQYRCCRSYCTQSSNAATISSFGAPYTPSVGIDPSTYDAIDELGMWWALQDLSAPVDWNEITYDGLFREDRSFVCGFSHHVGSINPTNSDYFNYYTIVEDDAGDVEGATSCDATVEFTGDIAVVGSDNPFSPDAQLYPQVEFRIYDSGGCSGATNQATVPHAASVMFKIELAGGVFLSCPFYGDASEDFIITAKKWWPYDKTGGGTDPAWNTLTGAKL